MSEESAFKKVASKSTFGKNLMKELKKRQEGGGGAAPTGKGEMMQGDSFARRLSKKIKEGEHKAPESESAEPEESAEKNGAPVGEGEWLVKEGDCIASIAKETGHFSETIWEDAGNTSLREARKDPYVLLPGDRVHVPALREKWVSKPAEMRHRFKRKGQPEMLNIRVQRDGEPRGNEPFTITIDGKEISGTTDADGKLSCPIIPNAKKAVLSVGREPDVTEHEILLGGIDPIDQISGVQGRLKNLGFDCGKVDGICGAQTRSAIREYQRSRRLPETGTADEATRKQLAADYGC